MYAVRTGVSRVVIAALTIMAVSLGPGLLEGALSEGSYSPTCGVRIRESNSPARNTGFLSTSCATRTR